MNSIDSDLEEGEIPDDSPSSPQIIVDKSRELPRRYVLRENKPTHKHKKECKYSNRNLSKKLNRLKKTPTRHSYKKHRKSYTHNRSHNNSKHDNSISKNIVKNSHSFSKHSLITDINCSFKDLLMKKQNFNPKANSKNNNNVTKNKVSSNENLSKFETVDSCKTTSVKDSKDTVKDSRQVKEQDLKRANDLTSFKELESSNQEKQIIDICSDSPKAESEDSEDEEELRRIALATCAKRKPVVESSENLNPKIVHESSEIEQFSPCRTGTVVLDNYEVVDMEVDDDTENSLEVLDNDQLFVIDTKPAHEGNDDVFKFPNKVIENNSDDDFEADILRAELIGNLFRKRAVLEQLEEQKTNAISHSQKVIAPLTAQIPVTYHKPKINLPRKPLRLVRRVVRKNSLNKPVKLNHIPPKFNQNSQVNKSPKRLVISLNEESSSEESDKAEEENSVPENPVASIEALISDCRQKSDSNEKNVDVKHVPNALSCLSKAQQEEYNSLRKILEEKKKLPVSKETLHPNKNAISPLDDLKLLEDKLLTCKRTLKEKKFLMTNMSKDLIVKKQMYMKSKLTAQHLKEKYVAAEKVRRIKLDEWSKSCKNFDVLKKSVSGLESKIIQMQNLCSKLGSTIQEQIRNSPSLHSNNS